MPRILTAFRLNLMKNKSENIRDEDSHINDHIRILRINSSIILQEINTNHKLSLRKLKNFDEANKLVNERLDTYEKMRDGQGCKVEIITNIYMNESNFFT